MHRKANPKRLTGRAHPLGLAIDGRGHEVPALKAVLEGDPADSRRPTQCGALDTTVRYLAIRAVTSDPIDPVHR